MQQEQTTGCSCLLIKIKRKYPLTDNKDTAILIGILGDCETRFLKACVVQM